MSDRNGIFYEGPEDDQSRAWRGCRNLMMLVLSLLALIAAVIFIYLYLMK